MNPNSSETSDVAHPAAAVTDTAAAAANQKTTVVPNFVYDLVELVTILIVYIFLVERILLECIVKKQFANLLLIPSEGLVVVMLLLRRKTDTISHRWQDWLLAFSATLTPLLVTPSSRISLVPEVVVAWLMFMGMCLQIHAKLSLGRSFGCVAANRGLRRTGPYRFIRHPMYAGYLVSHLGFLLANLSWHNLIVYTICYGLLIPRLNAEERLLEQDPQYRHYSEEVKYRLIPGVF
jgi:protein-S-isoprenylcysteine O-methyltransferase Ste14